MKITDLKCAMIGRFPIVRVATDEGISGYGPVEYFKPYLKPHVLHYRDLLIGENPLNVERTMLKIRNLGAFKPWGAAVSAIEIALWDIAGKAAGLPVHRLLGGKVRDTVRVYNGGVRFQLKGYEPEHYAEVMGKMKAAPEGFTMIKQAISFHSPMSREVPGYFHGEPIPGSRNVNRGLLTAKGMDLTVACVRAMREALGPDVALALDCGPGWAIQDAIRFARAVEPYDIAWLEDLTTGDYVPYVLADQFREITLQTTTPIFTGEQIYLRQNYKELFEKQAVRIIGPDPCDVGGMAELKRLAEYADLHGVLVAPHGIGDGLIGLGALVNLCATLPLNYVAFEYPIAVDPFWPEIVEGLPDPIVVNGHIKVWDRPGLGIDINAEAAKRHLGEEDRGFFD